MNKLIATSLLAAGLLLLDAPEAAAHSEVRDLYVSPAYYRAEHRRTHQMPRWLQHNKSFRHWYSHSRLKRDRRLGWYQLYDIYRWERFYTHRYRVDRRDWDKRYHRGAREYDRLQSRRHKH
jgi:hypothetical protein